MELIYMTITYPDILCAVIVWVNLDQPQFVTWTQLYAFCSMQ